MNLFAAILLSILVSYESGRSGRTVYGEIDESISLFMVYICLHNT